MCKTNHKNTTKHQRLLNTSIEDQQVRIDPGLESVNGKMNQLLRELETHKAELEAQNKELQRAQHTLEMSRDHFIELYDLAPIGYLSLNAEGIIAEANLTAAKQFGVERSTMIDQHFSRFIPDQFKDLWLRHFNQAKLSDDQYGCELPCGIEGKTVIYVHVDCRPVKKEGITQGLWITLTNVTQRKQYEYELRIAAAAFETCNGVVVMDGEKIILQVNQAFCNLTGFSAADLIGQTEDILFVGLDEHFHERIEESITRTGFWQGEISIKHKKGKIFPIWYTISTVTNTEGNLPLFVSSYTDLRLQKQTEKVLLESRQRLQNSMVATKHELEKNKREINEINESLSYLLKHQELDKAAARRTLTLEVEKTILPLLWNLKGASVGRQQTTHLIEVLEDNLQLMIKTFGIKNNLASAYHQLTPVEAQVASMVRQGMTTKRIAATLNSSPGTVNIHRKHIRKKLGLSGKAINLSSYLRSLDESESK